MNHHGFYEFSMLHHCHKEATAKARLDLGCTQDNRAADGHTAKTTLKSTLQNIKAARERSEVQT